MAEGHKPGLAGPVFGIITFFVGIAIMAFTFKLAMDMFGQDPRRLFELDTGKTLDINNAAATLLAVVVRILLLLVMAVVGGLIANRGIKLYADSRHADRPHRVKAEKEHT